MAGLGVLAILLGSVIAWAGDNDLSATTVIKAAVTGGPIPAYTKNAGARKALAEVLAFELIKAAASGLSSLIPGLGAAAAAGKSSSGSKGANDDNSGGGGDEDETPPAEPTDPFDFMEFAP